MATDRLAALVRQVRHSILRSTTAAGSGHPTSSLSAVELLTTLFFGGFFRADLRRPQTITNDRFILSKGHAAPLLYSIYAAAGVVSRRELLTLRKFGSRLEGHPMPRFPYAEVPTGSLGQGLSAGVGMALHARLHRLAFHTFVLLGDSEMSEGSVWEAIQLAGFQRLDSLIGILDVNRLGQAGQTMLGHHLQSYAQRIAAFGWNPLVIDGHHIGEIQRAYAAALKSKNRPTMIIAKTFKGKGVSFLEDKNGWHGKPLSKEQLAKALAELGPVGRTVPGVVRVPRKRKAIVLKPAKTRSFSYRLGENVAPRFALGQGLLRLARVFPNMVVLDGEVKNSTHTDLFAKKYPKRFVQTYIAEQNMVGVAAGLAARGSLPVAATFAAFFNRAADQLRMNGYAGTHQVYVGTHVGVSIGADGPSQMGLNDIALFRSVHGSTVLYPSDAVASEGLLELALRGPGVVYLRATRNALPVLYDAKTKFKIGGSVVVRKSRRDRVTLVAAGITLHEALKAADTLARHRIAVRVIDLYSIKPLDLPTLRAAAQDTGRLIVVEDHGHSGGMAEAIQSALGGLAGTVTSLAVEKLPRSGTPEELLRHQAIDAAAIVETVRSLLG